MAAAPGLSELYLACRNGDMPTVKRLLPLTTIKTLNRLEPNGSTCLHAASFHGHKDIVRLLLAHGACRTVVNRFGCTPLDEAKTEEIAELFPRSAVAAKKRFTEVPTQQLDWQFSKATAETYSRAFEWGCVKDRGVAKTVKKIRKAGVLEPVNEDERPDAEIVRKYFDLALEENNPIHLLKAYTVESGFYRNLNEYMAEGKPEKVFEKLKKKWSGYYVGLILCNAAFNPYRYSGETYRGMEVTQEDFARYQVGKALTYKSFQSTSKSWKIAKGFACPSEPRPGRMPLIIIFNIIDRRSALSIENISEYQHEEEVLIVPGTFFIVEDIDQNEVPWEIRLNQIEWKNAF